MTPKPRGLALSAAIMSGCNIFKIALQVLLLPTIARLLGPSEYGLYSLCLPSVMFMLMLADAGLGQSLAREDESEETVWSSAFWLLLSLGVGVSLALALWSIPLAAMTHQPRLPEVMAPLSLSALFLVLAVLPSARLTRRSRLGTYSLIDLGANVVAGLAALTAAFLHAGVWSLVIQMLTLYGGRSLALNLVAFRMPRLTFAWDVVKAHTALGGNIMAAKVVDTFDRMIEAGVVSRRFNAAAVGAFGFSNQIAWSLVQAAVNPIWMSLYVHALHEPDMGKLRALYERLLRLTVFLTVPGALLIAATSEQVVHIFLGLSWAHMIPLIAVIFPTQAIASCGQMVSAVLYAKGRARSQTVIATIYAGLRVAAVVCVFGGWPALALYIGAANLAFFALGLANAQRSCGWSALATLSTLRGALAAGAAGALAAHFTIVRLPANVVGLGVAFAVGGVLALAAAWIVDGARLRADLGQIARLLDRRRAEAHEPLPA